MTRYVFWLAVLLIIPGCNRAAGSAPVAVIDLIRELPRAEQRPPASVRVSVANRAGTTQGAIVVQVPSRVTWSVPLPRGGYLKTYVAVNGSSDAPAGPGETVPSVRFRVGISDHRTYEALTAITANAGQRGWTELHVDLSGYAGWQWSVFYRPDRQIWRLVLAADTGDGAGATAMWGSPEILASARAAREYVARRRELETSAHP